MKGSTTTNNHTNEVLEQVLALLASRVADIINLKDKEAQSMYNLCLSTISEFITTEEGLRTVFEPEVNAYEQSLMMESFLEMLLEISSRVEKLENKK